jgi:hypothetical protein
MPESDCGLSVAGLAIALACFIAVPATAQTKSGAKIVCWKDKSGKIVGCGDTVPPEYRDSGTKELDARGVTRGTTESAAEAARRRAQEQQAQKPAESKADDARRLAEQRRQDAALLGTYANEKEIDAKRERDLADTDTQLTQMRASLQVSTDRLNQAKKSGNKNDIARIEADRARIEKSIASKENEREEIRQKYAAQKARYLELKGGGQSVTPTAAPAPATKK